MLSSRRACLVSISLVVFVAGCSGGGEKAGPKVVAASGKVTYKNLPVEGATVSFLGDGKTAPAVAITDSAGEFELTTVRSGDVAVPGKHHVTVTKIITGATKAKAAKTKMSMEDAAKAAQDPPPAKPLSMLPDRYASADTSGLEFEVKTSGANVFEIKLLDE